MSSPLSRRVVPYGGAFLCSANHSIAIKLFDATCSVPKNVGEMAGIKARSPDNKSLARLYFDDDCSYPGWYVQYSLEGKSRKLALSTWDRDDVKGAHTEAARLLRCLPDRIQIESQSQEAS